MSEQVLTGLDGANPLGFLAALGTLRLLSKGQPEVRMGWRREGGWRPELQGLASGERDWLYERLLEAKPFPGEVMGVLGKNLTVPGATYRSFVERAEEQLAAGDSRAVEFAGAFGSEVCVDEKKGRIEYTNLCFITGSGHQDFIETAKALVKQVQREHLEEALFGPWRVADKSLSFRWDPGDAAEYALRWGDPSKEGASSVWGANRLAVEALPLLPVQPRSRGLETTAFREEGRTEEFTWPIWVSPIGCEAVRSLLTLGTLRTERPDRRSLSAMGIAEVFRARRVRIGQGANFKVSFRPARAV